MIGDVRQRQKPGDGYVSLAYLRPGFLFRATGAERVKGVNYRAFKIRNVFVGQNSQWFGMVPGEPWPATDLFKKWDKPMDVMMLGLDTTISFINVSGKPQPFAVKLVGKMLR